MFFALRDRCYYVNFVTFVDNCRFQDPYFFSISPVIGTNATGHTCSTSS